jgi:hypothetical protein
VGDAAWGAQCSQQLLHSTQNHRQWQPSGKIAAADIEGTLPKLRHCGSVVVQWQLLGTIAAAGSKGTLLLRSRAVGGWPAPVFACCANLAAHGSSLV